MKRSESASKHLLFLFGKVRDETISSQELAELESTLLADPAAMKLYRRFMALCSGLEQIARMQSDSGSEAAANFGASLSDDETFDWANELPPVVGQLPIAPRPAPPVLVQSAKPSLSPLRPARKTVISVGAMACIAATLVFVLIRFGRPSTASTYATLVDSHQPVWSGGRQVQPGEGLSATHYSLVSGAVRLRYDNKAELLVQAPSVFSIDGVNEATLHSGSLSLSVPPSASEFRVKTPWATVVDRGTRIGIIASEDEAMEVHVFEGKAETIRVGDRKGQTLKAGEAVLLASINSVPQFMAPNRSRFAEKIEDLDHLPNVSGDVELLVSSPRSVRRVRSELVDIGRATVFAEQKSVRLGDDLPVTIDRPGRPATLQSNGATIAAGTLVDTFLVHLAAPRSIRRTNQALVAKGKISFTHPVVGIVAAAPGRMDASLLNPDTEYPGDRDTGLEDSIEGNDRFADRLQLSSDRKTITFRLHVHGREASEPSDFIDQFRVLVEAK
ncbi:FecR protein [Rubripirellula tenax]|uniref:FecR protein n=1 Tax=Rubripirellula tenax TaxID=2528015 RepID=A0A5C6F0E1_9BACT|nr:FecR domain-containing protein [Rubripirellula tenax]TWU54752.1 FecR protein [Rubripirellula tenax]